MRSGWKLAAVGAVAVLAACPGAVNMQTRKSTAYTKRLDRVVVFVKPGRVDGVLEDAFKARLVAALGRRGVQAGLGLVDSSLALEAPPPVKDQVKAFQASTALFLLPAGGTVTQYGGLLAANYDGQLFEVAADRLVWRADIQWTLGSIALPAEQRADVFVDELLTALTADGLLSPAPPERPAASSPQPELVRERGGRPSRFEEESN